MGRIARRAASCRLADFGATVWKVEKPGAGDDTRHWGPPWLKDSAGRDTGEAAYYLSANRGKRSLAIDFTKPAGQKLIRGLAERADVLIENNLPRQMREWNLSYAQLQEINPRLVMISITPFGQTGPYSAWNGYDLNAFHLSGASSRYCGRPGEMPLEHGTFSADYFGAITGAAWGLAAVFGRDLVGGGQQVDVSCAEAIAAAFVGGQNIGLVAQEGRFDLRTGTVLGAQ